LKLRKQNEIIYELLDDVTAFEKKIELFIRQIERATFVHFQTCSKFKNENFEPPPTDKFVFSI